MGRFRYAGSAAIVSLALGLMSMQCAHAAVVLIDDFASSTPVLNWAGDGIFNPVSPIGNSPNPASVDLVGASNGFANLVAGLPPGAHAVDLDGTTGSGNRPVAGELQSVQSLPQGSHTVSG